MSLLLPTAVLLLLWPSCFGLVVEGQSLEGKRLSIVTILNEPFVMKSTGEGKEKFEGFFIDMMKLLQRELNFTYEIYEVADQQYGMLADGKWTGLMGDIVNKRANATLAPLRITGNRIQAVDFTVPVSSSGMSILYKAGSSGPFRLKTSISPTVLLKPFTPATWFLLFFMYIIYTALAFAIWLLSPYELNTRSTAEASILDRAKKAGCGAWLFVSGGLFLQGFARAPKAPSARVLGFAWWMFALASLSCYIANLVPLLSPQRDTRVMRTNAIESLKDLVQQTDVPYGIMRYGATQKMFEDSNLPLLKLAFWYLSNNPKSYVNSTAEAIRRVNQGNYAWIAEGVTAEYYAASTCNLTAVPAGLSSLDFGMAIAKGSELKVILDQAILKIKSNGELEALRARWWKNPNGQCSGAGDVADSGGSATSLLPGDLLLLYVLLILGAIAALATLPLELWIKSANLPGCGGGQQQTEATTAEAGSSESKTQKNDDATGDKEKPTPESQPLV